MPERRMAEKARDTTLDDEKYYLCHSQRRQIYTVGKNMTDGT